MLLVFSSPSKDIAHLVHHLSGEHQRAASSLVSFGVSGIYLSFLLTVIAAIIARRRGWVPEGSFRLGSWGWPVSIIAAALPRPDAAQHRRADGLTSGRARYFNIDWITLLVIVIIALVGAIYFFIARPDRSVARHLESTPPEAPPVTTAYLADGASRRRRPVRLFV